MTTPLHVLIVDDPDDDAALVLHELKRGGYAPEHRRVDTAAAMQAALDERDWDVVLSDHKMPGFNAPQALRLLQERDLDVPFILVSGSVGESAAVQMLKAGASDYVPRDSLSDLTTAVERALREAVVRKERRAALAALRDSEERFALAVRGSRDGLWDWRVASGRAYFSPRLEQMLGYDEHELGGELDGFLDLIHPEDRPHVDAALTDHLNHRIPCDVELRARTKQGLWRCYSFRGQALWDDEGNATRMAGSLSDITIRKRNEEAMAEQLELIGRQQEAIRTLSTPLIEVWDGVLTVPVLGILDVDRAQEMMQSLLEAVTRRSCRYVILDLTGVGSMDASTADHVIRIVRAVELLGARGLVVGIQAAVAQAIVSLGVDLSRIQTLGNLRDALVFCMRTSPARPR